MSTETPCPNCGDSDPWPILATTAVGVKLPGDSDAGRDSETKRELCVCGACGVCYDPVLASSDDGK